MTPFTTAVTYFLGVWRSSANTFLGCHCAVPSTPHLPCSYGHPRGPQGSCEYHSGDHSLFRKKKVCCFDTSEFSNSFLPVRIFAMSKSFVNQFGIQSAPVYSHTPSKLSSADLLNT